MVARPPCAFNASASSGAPTPVRPPGAGGSLCFEFWDDRCFRSFQPEDSHLLSTKFEEHPRPKEVGLAGGKYVVQNFDRVEEGIAVQVNAHSQFERHVRLKPPYRLPGAREAKLPQSPIHFVFEDEQRWRPYSPRLQKELEQVLQCAPLPQKYVFVEEGKTYFLLGLDTLVQGLDNTDIIQVNCRTQNFRKVQVQPGTAAVSPASAPANAPAMSSPKAQGARLMRMMRGAAGAGNSAASASNSWQLSNCSSGFSSAGPFSLGAAVFCLGARSGQQDKAQILPLDAAEVLCKQWRCDPRPEKVKLPGGGIVDNFADLEVGGTTCHYPATGSSNHPFSPSGLWGRSKTKELVAQLEAHLPPAHPGQLVLPEALDVDTSCNPESYGRYLSNAEVAQLPSRGAEANKCSICLCEMEPEGGSRDTDVPMVPMDDVRRHKRSNQDAGTSAVFELQCGHAYHIGCINQWFEQRRRCPQCQKDFGKVIGDQPRRGTMQWHLEPFSLPGHPNTSQTIIVQFEFPAGVTDQGTQHDGRKPKGYLPGNTQGIILLELFKIAFRRRVMFGMGNSMTFGTVRPTFNIHIKTSTHRGTTCHGYPDDSYFKRALEELHTNGVTMADLPA